jgi:hypothetical protein
LRYDTLTKGTPCVSSPPRSRPPPSSPRGLADPPDTRTHTDVNSTRTITVCGFPVVIHSEGVFTTWNYFDESGNLVRQRLHVERAFTVTWSNPANGKSISSVLGGPVVNEFAPDGTQTQTVAGRERLFIARGEGPIAKQVGRIVFIVADGTIDPVRRTVDLDITLSRAYLA